MQRGDRGNTPMAKQGERRVPCAGAVEHLRRLPRAELLEVDAGREAGAETENHQRAGLVLSPAHRRLERVQKRVANSVALVRPIEPQPSDTVTQLVSHSAFGTHSCASYWHRTSPSRLSQSICVGLELRKGQQYVVPLMHSPNKEASSDNPWALLVLILMFTASSENFTASGGSLRPLTLRACSPSG